MSLRFFNTYSREIEDFEARDPAERKIGIYTCGPTVYSRAHIGNFRAYVFEDLLQRHLELRGYKMHRVMNITDVDDKTIGGAREANVPLAKFSEQFKQAFFEDAKTLRIKRADEFHCGGVDNIFPHHEAEIAQSEGVTGKKFVRYWLHCAHLLVDGQKMSKSLGNFYTLPNLLEKGYTGREIRYALMRVHYRAPLNVTWDGMDEARQALARVDEWLIRLRECSASVPLTKTKGEQAGSLPYTFEDALDDDLNISAALGFLFETIRETNRAMDRGELDPASATGWLDWWKRINNVLDLETEDEILQPAEIVQLAKDRENARREKNWKRSDELRDRISALGWEVRDTKDGQKITRGAGSG